MSMSFFHSSISFLNLRLNLIWMIYSTLLLWYKWFVITLYLCTSSKFKWCLFNFNTCYFIDTKPDKPILLRLLSSINSKCYELRDLLGVDSDTLESLSTCPCSEGLKMLKILQSWLDMNQLLLLGAISLT